MACSDERCVTVGVLALQGAFHEHIARFASLCAASSLGPRVRAVAVRNAEQLAACDGVVIPGGESTTISLGLRNAGLLGPLRAWIQAGRPVWGTCAGMIMLSAEATGGKRGGQELLGGVDIQVGRNGFGSQVNSFEAPVDFPVLGADPFPGVFIRAPVVEQLFTDTAQLRDNLARAQAALPTQTQLSNAYCPPVMLGDGPRPPLQILGCLSAPNLPPHSETPARAHGPADTHVLGPHPPSDTHIVALRQGAILITSFHPELTHDTRLHAYFVREVIAPLRSEP
ncbi:pyridoxal 5'-phosphate synthase (glutamine hydrolyzing) [Malassezia sp. CBS 17886]|nr:pyridoxal 5'-phosphate synthase (glutamine hydrolyzing) [Malassezia sp. CBS 17886]